MNLGFWGKLKKPFVVLSPMADVTDFAFRETLAEFGAPDVFYTEFVSADGLCSDKGRENLLIDLKFSEKQRPIVAQIFSGKPEKICQAAKLVKELGFDGIDINMGCPQRKIEKQGAGAKLIQDPTLAKEIVEAAKEGAGDLPVSVKTRIGYNKIQVDWVEKISEMNVAAAIFHLRTRKEMSKVSAHWELAKEISKIFKNKDTLIIANGDVKSLKEAKEKCQENNFDGVAIGRGFITNPWLMSGKEKARIPFEEKLETLLDHTKLFEETFKDKKSFAIMKKFFSTYVTGHPEAKKLRMRLMETENHQQIEGILTDMI